MITILKQVRLSKVTQVTQIIKEMPMANKISQFFHTKKNKNWCMRIKIVFPCKKIVDKAQVITSHSKKI